MDFDPLPFDSAAAARYGTLAALVLEAERDPRRLDPAIASARELPLYTRDPADFRGLDDMVELIAV